MKATGKTLPKIAVTMGDPAGIGPEVVSKAVSSPLVRRICRPVLIGDRRFWDRRALAGNTAVRYEDIPVRDPDKIRPGRVSITAGRAAYDCICRAVEMVKAGGADAIVTAPLSKAALNLAGINYAGHTELLAALTGTRDYAMLMAADGLRAVMVTRHLPLMETAAHLSVEEIVRVTALSRRFLEEKNVAANPRIVICSLNPHAGEGGLLGREEGKIIIPAVQALRDKGYAVTGPLPADSAWVKMKKGEFDLMVTLYHDQAMIGLKCLAPEKIVNITIGLPVVRTSPGHGTGFDIAGKNCADPRSTIEAIRVAVKLSRP
jgi:4-hydroxythreonine-4-phosphate dehydrogenase